MYLFSDYTECLESSGQMIEFLNGIKANCCGIAHGPKCIRAGFNFRLLYVEQEEKDVNVGGNKLHLPSCYPTPYSPFHPKAGVQPISTTLVS